MAQTTTANNDYLKIINGAQEQIDGNPDNPFLKKMDFMSYIESFKRVIEDGSYAEEKHLSVNRQGDLYLVKCKREYLTKENAETLGLFRSVILKKDIVYMKNQMQPLPHYRVLFAAQPKSVELEEINFDEKKYPIYIESIIEGTMINLFHDGDKWRIATRSCIGANTQFYQDEDKSMTYRQMFMEVFKAMGLKLEYFSKNIGYSFVLQHPNNRIVMPIKMPHLFLVNMFVPKTNDGCENVCYMQLGDDGTQQYMVKCKLLHPKNCCQHWIFKSYYDAPRKCYGGIFEYERRLKKR